MQHDMVFLAGRLYRVDYSGTGPPWPLLVWNGGAWQSVGPNPFAVPTVRAQRVATLALANATNTPIPFDQTQYDSGTSTAQHETVTNPTRITCQQDGVYIVDAFVGFASNAAGQRYASMRKNGSVVQFVCEDGRDALSTDVSEIYIGAQMRLTAGEYVEVLAWQNSGGSLNLRNDSGLNAYCAWTRVA